MLDDVNTSVDFKLFELYLPNLCQQIIMGWFRSLLKTGDLEVIHVGCTTSWALIYILTYIYFSMLLGHLANEGLKRCKPNSCLQLILQDCFRSLIENQWLWPIYWPTFQGHWDLIIDFVCSMLSSIYFLSDDLLFMWPNFDMMTYFTW